MAQISVVTEGQLHHLLPEDFSRASLKRQSWEPASGLLAKTSHDLTQDVPRLDFMMSGTGLGAQPQAPGSRQFALRKQLHPSLPAMDHSARAVVSCNWTETLLHSMYGSVVQQTSGLGRDLERGKQARITSSCH